MSKERQEKYELLYIIPSKYTEDEVKSIMDKIKGILENGGAVISEMHNLGKRRLAYPIKHVRFGNYVLVWFECDKAAMAKLNEVLRLTAEVLRHVIVSFNPLLNKVPNFAEEEQQNRRQSAEGEERTERKRPMSQAPAQKKSEPVDIEDLDKKLDKILNEEVE